jgi:hypothetical protein
VINDDFSITAAKQAYVPPSLRGQQNKPSTKLHEYELPSNVKQSQAGSIFYQSIVYKKIAIM